MPFSVLIVDDHEPMRTLLGAVFTRAGAMVREARDGATALALFEQAPADVVVMDQSMPGMSGVALIAALRARSGAVRLILLSGHKSPALSDEARQAGADAVLAKPVSPRLLMETVNAVLLGPPAPSPA
jgi:CheY-like chemotaxis protein